MKYTMLPLAALITASFFGCAGKDLGSSSATAVSSQQSSLAVSSAVPSSSVASVSSAAPVVSSATASSAGNAGFQSITLEENQPGFCAISGTGSIDTKHAGFKSAGFVDSENTVGSSIMWQVNVSESAEYSVTIRYALLDGENRSGTLTANENLGVIASFDLAPTGAWATWQDETQTIALNAGSNRLVLKADTELGLSNIDSITISGPGVMPEMCAVAPTSSSGNTSSAGAAGGYVYSGPIESGDKGQKSTLAGGFSTATGAGLPVYNGAGAVTGSTMANAQVKFAKTHTEMNSYIAAADNAYPLMIIYTGNEDALIHQIVKDHTVDANNNCPKAHWNDEYREVQIKEYTAGITIIGANGSSANFGITLIKSNNVIIRNMKIGALGGANNDADMLRVDNTSNVWIDHNELFAVNNECNGSPDGDLTFESALDIKKDSNNVTISYNYIHDSKKVGLDGHTSNVAFQRHITFHHNVYKNVNGRLPLQRGGWIHVYNNFYSDITGSGINVRTGGNALVENNWFENSANPLTCRFDTDNCGKWELKGNNLTSASDNAKYNVSWTSAGSGGVNADSWTTTGSFPISLYSYEAATAACVRARLESVAGVGKNFAALSCN